MNARRLAAAAVAAVLALAAPAVSSAQTASPAPTPTAEPSTSVQGQQNSENASASSGSASGSNSSQVSNGNGNRMQHGSNSTTVRQSGSAQAGDSVAGSQVTGVNGPNATISNVNNSENARATVGNATVNNTVDALLGPSASLLGDANVFQSGDNNLVIEQGGRATTGDAVANSQVTGIVGGGDHTVLNTNNAECTTDNPDNGSDPCAQGGNADVLNLAGGSAGPFASSESGAASATQSGSNVVELVQAAEASTGDAVNGSTVLGSVGGSIVASSVNRSECDGFDEDTPCALSGDASANSIGALVAGPTAFSFDTAIATQTGDNTTNFDQIADAVTGDGVSGTQIYGIVGPGDAVILGTNNSDGDVAASGDADSSIDVIFGAGAQANVFDTLGGAATATQNGNNYADGVQASNGATGDAVAGTQIASGVGLGNVSAQLTQAAENIRSISGNFLQPGAAAISVQGFTGASAATDSLGTSASASQTGNNAAVVGQDVTFKTGDAVAAGQVGGFVDITESASIQASNDAENVAAVSGSADFENMTTLNSGTAAFSPETASANQTGNNVADVRQSLEGSSGDAVGGGQIFGIVGDSNTNASIQAINNCEGDDDGELCSAESGSSIAINDALVEAGTRAIGVEDDGVLSVQQTGDNATFASQKVTSGSGDAAAGSQVSGAVLGGEFNAQLTANSEFAFASSGATEASNLLDVGSGPEAYGADEFVIGSEVEQAFVSQSGNNTLEYDQSANGNSGDAVAGALIAGVSGARETSIQTQGNADDATASSSNTIAANAVVGSLGPVVSAFVSNATQNGNSTSDGSQDLTTGSGDAIAGGQVTGAVSILSFLSLLGVVPR